MHAPMRKPPALWDRVVSGGGLPGAAARNLCHDSNGMEGKMAADATDVRREADTKIRARIVAAWKRPFASNGPPVCKLVSAIA